MTTMDVLVSSSYCTPVPEPGLAGGNTLPEQEEITIIDLCSYSTLAEQDRDECSCSRC